MFPRGEGFSGDELFRNLLCKQDAGCCVFSSGEEIMNYKKYSSVSICIDQEKVSRYKWRVKFNKFLQLHHTEGLYEKNGNHTIIHFRVRWT